VNKSVGRSISTPSLDGDLLYQAEYNGNIHCLDAKTGKTVWMHPTNSRIWSSTLVADGKVYCGNEDGELVILKAGREKQLISKIDFYTPVYCSPVAANNTLFVAARPGPGPATTTGRRAGSNTVHVHDRYPGSA
jgi:outer membrane protein assembly factor BamB